MFPSLFLLVAVDSARDDQVSDDHHRNEPVASQVRLGVHEVPVGEKEQNPGPGPPIGVPLGRRPRFVVLRRLLGLHGLHGLDLGHLHRIVSLGDHVLHVGRDALLPVGVVVVTFGMRISMSRHCFSPYLRGFLAHFWLIFDLLLSI